MKLSRRTVLGALAAAPAVARPAAAQPAGIDAFAYNRLLGRGINLGNALEAPKEGEWGVTLREEYFEEIRKAGFDSVRIPVRWSAHAAAEPPYRIEPEFFRRIDWALDQALSRRLAVVLNVHHYEEIYREPDAHLPRLLGLWEQIAERYRSRPERLSFEILNEPNGKLTDEAWQRIFPQVLRTIRESNPRRVVIVGPGNWNNVGELPKLELPEADRMLIGTFHYYSPFEFTHQEAEWVENSARWKGTTWTATPAQLEAVKNDFTKAAQWAERHRRPVYLGEFGAYSKAELPSRVKWTAAIAREAEARGFSWAYWEFCSGFGAYDPAANRWRAPLLQALLPSG
ncbi:MAG: glycoside hydrolase family 5 protein [Armatimonadota bacterium]